MKYYMVHLYSDVNNRIGVREVLGFTVANSQEEARLNMNNMIKNYQPIMVGIMELSGEKELNKRRNRIVREIEDLKKVSDRIKHREKLLRNIQFVKQKSSACEQHRRNYD